mmetsp:Transcript_14254/g.21533  ORF Transcript_14254/g.21533 Transcript_14254/m.21533 type:complete len:377 (-) Transcript_14254:136-1266(-)|eukprot:CAMPEP_0202715370 /NCGR_PEP_ID=MMETSP1385-20130828/88937_1 /ASSEMBLY_ACC=CAM_ASM_000861 /TAXON_ID=933848 /ORGANISM="Elphidium margaritaceum" /LENGTH=376 /DNA_ID=CAMNT_0049376593 /DNA_START=34 /DNA_END=1164 /DNA_ORIENTATION=+
MPPASSAPLVLALLTVAISHVKEVCAACSGSPDRGAFAKVAVPAPFQSRNQWNAADFDSSCDCDSIVAMNPNKITVHHTATSSSQSVQNIQSLHQNTNGWCDIGYHFLIDIAGTIYQGRPFWDDADVDTTPRDADDGQWPQMALIQGSHAGGNNVDNIGISLIGCFDSRSACDGIRTSISTTSSTQYDALVSLVAYLCDMYDITPSSSTIIGHNDLSSTLCPGDNLHNLLDDVITAADALLDDACAVPNSNGGDDLRGVCIDTGDCDNDRVVTSNYCPNHAANIKCCHNKACQPYTTYGGGCMDTGACNNHDSHFVSNKCPNQPDNVKCCLRQTCQTNDGIGGYCVDVANCDIDDGRSTEIGHCPGSSAIKCCYYP